MNFRVQFSEQGSSFRARFGEVHNISDGGYERGYAAGYEVGNAEGAKQGYTNGYNDGLAARTYEIWTITYVDGAVEEKKVALL